MSSEKGQTSVGWELKERLNPESATLKHSYRTLKGPDGIIAHWYQMLFRKLKYIQVLGIRSLKNQKGDMHKLGRYDVSSSSGPCVPLKKGSKAWKTASLSWTLQLQRRSFASFEFIYFSVIVHTWFLVFLFSSKLNK